MYHDVHFIMRSLTIAIPNVCAYMCVTKRPTEREEVGVSGCVCVCGIVH